MNIGYTKSFREVAVIVAHPDDETLWTGGTILSQPSCRYTIISLCRAGDRDRAPRFARALKDLGGTGAMGDLDDGPEQKPLTENEVQEMVLRLLSEKQFDLIITHNPAGEYTRHLRHEEIGRAVIGLWHTGKISAEELWTFAYEDGYKQYLPKAIKNAHLYYVLPERVWQRKRRIITSTYGFPEDGFEVRTTPRAEAFWQFTNSAAAQQWLDEKLFHYESSRLV